MPQSGQLEHAIWARSIACAGVSDGDLASEKRMIMSGIAMCRFGEQEDRGMWAGRWSCFVPRYSDGSRADGL